MTETLKMVEKIHYRVFGYSMSLVIHFINMLLFIRALMMPKDPDLAYIMDMKWRYITVWNLVIQSAYAVIGLICDVPVLLKTAENSRFLNLLRWYRSVLLNGIYFPCGVFIFIVFWPIFLYDRELIFPAIIDEALPPASNHIMHSAICPLVLWESVFAEKRRRRPDLLTKAHVTTLILAYNIVMHAGHYETGRWPYPMMAKAYGTIYFPLLYLYILSLCVFSYYAQWCIPCLLGLSNKAKRKNK